MVAGSSWIPSAPQSLITRACAQPKGGASNNGASNNRGEAHEGQTAGAANADRGVALARLWFEEGVAAVEAGQWAAAAAKFEQVLRVKRSAVVSYNLASALSHLGRVREAVELLRDIQSDGDATEVARSSARKLLATLEEQLGIVTVRASGDTRGVVLHVGERILSADSLNKPIEVDAGTVSVAIRRQNQTLARTQVEVGGEHPPIANIVLVLPSGGVRAPVATPEETARRAPTLANDAQTRHTSPVTPTRNADTSSDDGGSWLESPWFWGGVVAVVAAGTAAAFVVAGAEPEAAPPTEGNLDPAYVSGSVVSLSSSP